MTQGQYKSEQLNALLETMHRTGTSGTLQINAKLESDRPIRSRILVLHKGEITYADSKLPSIPTLALKLVKQFNPSASETVIQLVRDRVTKEASAREFFAILCKMGILTWEQIEAFFKRKPA